MGGVHATLLPEFDTDAALEAEAVIFNKLIIDRVKAGIITPEKAAEELGYDASDVPDEPEPPPVAEPQPVDTCRSSSSTRTVRILTPCQIIDVLC